LRQELALARQRLQGMPSTDEIDFWKSGLKKAAAELKEKGQMLAGLQAAAGHYPEKLAIQTKALQSLKAQLEGVQQELSKSQGIVDDKTKEILRLKYLSKMAQQDWRKQVMELNRKLDAAQKKFGQKMYENRIMALEKQISNLKARLQQKETQKKEEVPENLSFPIAPEPGTDTFQILQEQLQNAQQELAQTKGELEDKTKEIVVLTHKLDIAEKKFNRKAYDNQMTALEAKFQDSLDKIKELQAQVNALEVQSKGDAVRAKLEQAVDKIQAQGRMINILSQKLEEAQNQNTGK